jgi:glutaredoxin 3
MSWFWRAPWSLPPSCFSLAQVAVSAQLSCMSRIVLYTTPFCGYCRAAKRLLVEKALYFEEIDVAFDADKRAEMLDRAKGARTVPQIFIHGRHVGGYDELAMLEREGKLDGWLAEPAELAEVKQT